MFQSHGPESCSLSVWFAVVPTDNSRNVALIVGLSVGLGVPFIILVIIVLVAVKTSSGGKASKFFSAKGITVVEPKQVEKGRVSISPSPSTASTQPITLASAESEALPEASFFWAPEKPQQVAHVNQEYVEETE
jgi:hypothetical protein